MKGIGNKTYVLIIMIIVSCLLTMYSIYISSQELVTGTGLYNSWAFIFSALMAMWIVEDKKENKEHASFSFGAIALILWPIVLFSHLVKTRGLEGVVFYLGFWVLYAMANVMNLVFYVSSW